MFKHPLDISNRQNGTIVFILRVRFTIPLIVVDFHQHIREVFVCKVLPINQIGVKLQNSLPMLVCITLIINTDVLIQLIDDDCMAKNGERRVFGEPPMSRDESYKYLILRPDCKLYSQWDDKASLIF